jgi:hypothetical protein
MKLDERVMRGNVFYFDNLNYDPVGKRLTIEFLGDPQSPAVVRVLTFSGVEDFSEEEFEDENADAGIKFTDQLIGLDEYPGGKGVRYVVHTHLREMIFRTWDKPHVEDV